MGIIKKTWETITEKKEEYVDVYYEEYDKVWELNKGRVMDLGLDKIFHFDSKFDLKEGDPRLTKEGYEEILFDVFDWEVRDIRDLLNGKDIYKTKGKKKIDVPLVLGDGVIYINENVDVDKEEYFSERWLFEYVAFKRAYKYLMDGIVRNGNGDKMDIVGEVFDVVYSYGLFGDGIKRQHYVGKRPYERFLGEAEKEREYGGEYMFDGDVNLRDYDDLLFYVMGNEFVNSYGANNEVFKRDIDVYVDEYREDGKVCEARELDLGNGFFSPYDRRDIGVRMFSFDDRMKRKRDIKFDGLRVNVLEMDDFVVVTRNRNILPKKMKDSKEMVNTLGSLF